MNRHIDNDEVNSVLNELPKGKSPGIDGLCYEILKCGGEKLLDYMVKLFNKILETGLFPDLWGDAIITPIHKSGSINTAENYRGISLLCTMENYSQKC